MRKLLIFVVIVISAFLVPQKLCAAFLGDVNGDGKVDIIDIGVVIDNYAKTPIANRSADVNSDGVVDIIDIGIIIDNYGKVSSATQAPSVSAQNPVRQTIVYDAPKWPATGASLSASEVAQKIGVVLYARSQMKVLPNYVSAGFKGTSLVYLIMDTTAGPAGLSSIAAQKTLCTAAQKSTSVYSNSATMDTGDFCDIHDAIINKTHLSRYTDIFPTENWFLHSKTDGSRLTTGGGGALMYRTNPGDPNWREYYARRALREVAPTDPNHLPISGVNGIFIDNVGLSWGPLQNTKEYLTSDAYVNAVLDFVKTVHTKLNSGTYKYAVWGNMISDPGSGSAWDKFDPYLEGGMDESFGLDWGRGPSSIAKVQNELTQADSWISKGNNFLGVAQGDSSETYIKYTYGLTLLVTDGHNASYKYANHAGSYSEYYEIPEFYIKFGLPISARRVVTSSPLVYERCFQNGSVRVDLTNHNATFNPPCK